MVFQNNEFGGSNVGKTIWIKAKQNLDAKSSAMSSDIEEQEEMSLIMTHEKE